MIHSYGKKNHYNDTLCLTLWKGKKYNLVGKSINEM